MTFEEAKRLLRGGVKHGTIGKCFWEAACAHVERDHQAWVESLAEELYTEGRKEGLEEARGEFMEILYKARHHAAGEPELQALVDNIRAAIRGLTEK